MEAFVERAAAGGEFRRRTVEADAAFVDEVDAAAHRFDFLQNVRHLPPLVRVSLGLHNTVEDIDALDRALKKILQSV